MIPHEHLIPLLCLSFAMGALLSCICTIAVAGNNDTDRLEDIRAAREHFARLEKQTRNRKSA
jgi:hypothetical protein